MTLPYLQFKPWTFKNFAIACVTLFIILAFEYFYFHEFGKRSAVIAGSCAGLLTMYLSDAGNSLLHSSRNTRCMIIIVNLLTILIIGSIATALFE